MIYEEFVYKTCARLLAGGRDGGDQCADGVCDGNSTRNDTVGFDDDGNKWYINTGGNSAIGNSVGYDFRQKI